jgi:hypothetical protein
LGVQIFQSTDAPRYAKGFTAHFCLYGLFNVLLVAIRFLYMQRNKQKVAVRGEGERDHANAFLDLTDKENVDFVVSDLSFLNRLEGLCEADAGD